MITDSQVRNVSSFGNVVEASYTIEDSAKIFSILRSNIYSDKILAVIREYSTNGWDGHVLAGTPDRKLLVTLPTSLSPIFKVRDFGVGLSEEAVMTIYTSYGTSTKDKSNDFNGTFGLGSKSAFAYGNTFGITSYYNGVKTLYTAYLDETNIGKIRKEYSEPTDEHNGVEIEVAVKNADIRVFNETAVNFYKHFQPCPDFVGGDGTVVDSINNYHNLPLLFTGSNWKIIDFNAGWRGDACYVRMGNVAYPLNHSALSWTDNRASMFQKNVVVFDVPIGSVSITASREALEYDNRTKDYLIGQMCLIHSELLKQTQDKIDACSTFWEASVTLNNLKNVDGSITAKVSFDRWTKAYGVGVLSTYYGTSVGLDDKFILNNVINKFNVTLKTYNHFNSPRISGYRTSYVNPSDRYVFVLNRPGKVKKDEISWRLRGVNAVHKNKELILVDFTADNSAQFKDGVFKGATFVNLEDFDIVKYSNGRAPVRRYNSNTEMSKAKIFTWGRTNDSKTKSNNWEIASNDLIAKGGGVFVTINSYDYVGRNNRAVAMMGDVLGIVHSLENMGIDVPTIYGIRDSVDATKLNSNWKHFEDWVVEVVNKKIGTDNLADSLMAYNQVQSLMVGNAPFQSAKRYYRATYSNGFTWLIDPSFPDCDLRDFAIKVDAIRNDSNKGIATIYNLMQKYSFLFQLGHSNVQNELDTLTNKYPGLKQMLVADYEQEELNELIRYVAKFDEFEERCSFRVVI